MADPEIDAMSQIAEALAGLGDAERRRVLRWAAERYQVGRAESPRERRSAGDDEVDVAHDEDDGSSAAGQSGGADGDSFEHFAELYDAVAPSSDPERVLVAAYWQQVCEGKAPFGSLELNKMLKQLGHGVGTINKAMSSNIDKRPALILQVSRGGSSQQSRKKYKVTEAGVKWVRGRLS